MVSKARVRDRVVEAEGESEISALPCVYRMCRGGEKRRISDGRLRRGSEVRFIGCGWTWKLDYAAVARVVESLGLRMEVVVHRAMGCGWL